MVPDIAGFAYNRETDGLVSHSQISHHLMRMCAVVEGHCSFLLKLIVGELFCDNLTSMHARLVRGWRCS